MKTIANGVWPVMITPFTEDNKIDYAAVEKIIEWYNDVNFTNKSNTQRRIIYTDLLKI